MNSSEIMDLLGSVGDGPYVKNVDIVIVIETSENMSKRKAATTIFWI